MAKDLTQGKIYKNLYELAWPMTVGILAIMGFNVVDTFFVGQLGTQELAAMSFTFPVVMITGSISLGIGAALSSMLSREYGAKRFDDVKAITTNGLAYALIIVALLTIIGFLTMDPLFRSLGAEGRILILVKQYMRIWYLNVLFVVVPMVGNGAIRATGDTRFPAMVMVVAGGVNLIFDPLLIFGLGPFPRMELEGAALATGISRVFTLAASLYVLHFREKLLEIPFQNMTKTFSHWKDLSKIAIPAALSNAVVPFSMFFITALIAKEGANIVAAFGVGTRIESLVMVLIFGIAAGLSPFIGQNYGGKKYSRVANALASSNMFSLFWVVLAVSVLFLWGEQIVSIFSDDASVTSVVLLYLKIVIPTLCIAGVFYNTASTLNAIGNAKLSLFLTVLQMVVIYIPAALVLGHFYRAEGIFYAAAISNIIAGVTSFFLFKVRYPNCSKVTF